jgi:hypothetical protein
MSKYEYLIKALIETGTGTMKCFGNSMLPILSNPSICTYAVQYKYQVDDIVFCKVRGRFIDAHLITKIDGDRYMIANNHGWENGWTKTIYGKVIEATNKDNKVIYTMKKRIDDNI